MYLYECTQILLSPHTEMNVLDVDPTTMPTHVTAPTRTQSLALSRQDSLMKLGDFDMFSNKKESADISALS